MCTQVTRTGRHGHRIKKVNTWCYIAPVELTVEERERTRLEDLDIKRRREAFGLH